jgi:hypothetical protein
MKEEKLREHAVCNVCDKPIGESGLPIFFTVQVREYMVDLAAAKRQTGLAEMLGGNAALAMIMGPDEDLASEIMKPVTLTVCAPCAWVDKLVVTAVGKSEDG